MVAVLCPGRLGSTLPRSQQVPSTLQAFCCFPLGSPVCLVSRGSATLRPLYQCPCCSVADTPSSLMPSYHMHCRCLHRLPPILIGTGYEPDYKERCLASEAVLDSWLLGDFLLAAFICPHLFLSVSTNHRTSAIE